MLTPAQLQTLKADILANPDLSSKPNNSDGNFAISQLYSITASPVFIVWKTNVSITQVGDNIVATELAGLTATNLTRLQTIAGFSPGGVNPSLSDRRAFFDDVFSGAGGQLTRPKLLALWKRNALRGERLFATGNGQDATPGLLVIEGNISTTDIDIARNLP